MSKWNWKSFGSGFLCSTLLFGLGASAMAAGAGGNILFNQVNIGTDEGTIAAQNSGYRLENGQNVPYSITYMDGAGGGTVYLPIRKISEFTQTGVSWDGSANKVVLDVDTNAAYNTMTGKVGTYQEGYTAGYNDGVASRPTSSGSYDRGYDDGYDDGYSDGKKVNSNSGNYQTGYNNGYTDGYNAGKAAGSGSTSDRYQEGYDAGFAAGKVQGKTEGEKSGYDKGFAAGEESGYQKGYEAGYADGEKDAEETEPPEETPPEEDLNKYNFYSEFPSVPDFGDVTGAKSAYPRKNTLENGVAYDYDLIDYQECLEKYAKELEKCGFSKNNETEENYGVTYIYQKEDVYVHIGVKASLMTNGIGVPVYTDSTFSRLAQEVKDAKKDVITANTERPIYDVGSGQWIPDQLAIQKANEALVKAQSEYDEYLNKAINTYSVIVKKG